jgi:hypothetical protein
MDQVSTSSDDLQLVCKNCPVGMYRTDAVREPVACETCASCPAGYKINAFSPCNTAGNTQDRNCLECPAGQYTKDVDAASCKVCPSGFFRRIYTETEVLNQGKENDPTSCEPCGSCQAGQYRIGNCSMNALGTCLNCPDGFYSSGINAPECKACPSGHFRNDDAVLTRCETCRKCPAGWHVDANADCGATALTADRQCVSCSNGQYSSSLNLAECQDCPRNFFRVDPGTRHEGDQVGTSCTQCAACPAGQSVLANRMCNATGGTLDRMCVTCASGRFTDEISSDANALQMSCKACPAGHFRSAAELPVGDRCQACLQCPAGFRVNPGQNCNGTALTEDKDCIACGNGQYAADMDMLECVDCPPHFYRIHPAVRDPLTGTACVACSFCPKGFVVASDRMCNSSGVSHDRVCLDCDAGKYMDVQSGSQTDLSASPLQLSCKDCPRAFFRTDIVVPDMDRCQPCSSCPGGFKIHPDIGCNVTGGLQDRACLECPVGKFNKEADVWACTTCPAGFFRKEYSAHEKSLGFENDPTSCEPCGDCQAGQYMTGNCTEDVTGTCEDCPAGFFSDGKNAQQCKACPSGHFRNENAALTRCQTCQECPAGTHINAKKSCDQSGLTSDKGCLACARGKFAAELDQTECAFCPPNTYQNTKKSAACKDCSACPPGKSVSKWMSCDRDGSKTNRKCDICPKGTFMDVSSGAWNETAGAFSSIAKKCKSCPQNYFNSGKNKADCQLCRSCPPGKSVETSKWGKCDSSGQQSNRLCVPCDAGKYQDEASGSLDMGSKTVSPLQMQCKACPAHFFRSTGLGKQAAACKACRTCGKGTFVHPELNCEQEGLMGDKMCITCPSGRFADSTDMLSCKACPAGTFRANPANAGVECLSCASCPIGKVVDSLRACDSEGLAYDRACDECDVG